MRLELSKREKEILKEDGMNDEEIDVFIDEMKDYVWNKAYEITHKKAR